MAKRKYYSEQFKKGAVRLVRNRGTRTVAEIADELGINPSMLTKWHQAYAEEVTTGHSKAQAERDEIEKLRRKLREVEMENALLRKAAALFAKDVK